jgi:plastocyanin
MLSSGVAIIMQNSLLVFAVPLVLLFASACAPTAAGGSANSPGGAGGPQQVTIKGQDALRFDPATVTVKTGQPLQVTFQNSGQIMHDFTVQEGPATPVVITEDGGKSGTATMTFDKPGTCKFFCSPPGHDAAGMHGTITVQ